MNKVLLFLRGFVRIRINGSATDQFVNKLSENRIPFWDPIWYDPFTMELCLFRKDLTAAEKLAERTMCELTGVCIIGLVQIYSRLFRRPVLLLGILGSLILIIFAQQYLFFYDVTGNSELSDKEIIRVLDSMGVSVGIYGPDIKPKWIKDHALQLLPELQWITITQNGSMAQIVVRERQITPQVTDRKGYANIVATRSGLITQQAVYEGQAMKEVGDIVSEGELLVSGIVDLERLYSIVHAQAEIFARTWYDTEVLIPQKWLSKEYCQEEMLCVWLEFGKRHIKIFENSRISDAACDKIINRYILTLPGNNQLPIKLMIERLVPYTMSPSLLAAEEAQLVLETYAINSAEHQMTAGRILSEHTKFDSFNDCYRLRASFECHEMIAKTVEGKWKKEDFMND